MSAAQGTIERILEVTKGELGVVEGPKSNQTKYGAFTKANFEPWCGSFIMWTANQAGVKVPNCVYTPTGAEAFQKAKKWFITDPQVGDVVFFRFSLGVGLIEHVGWVVAVNKNGTIVTREGNTSPEVAVKGSQANGGQVAERIRTYGKPGSVVVGFGRPDYAKTSVTPSPVKKEPVQPFHPISFGETSADIKAIQAALKIPVVDGIYGPVTQKAIIHYQQQHPKIDTNQDGVVTAKWFRAITSGK